MGVQDWNWRLAAEYQDVPWDCSAASVAWSLTAAGHPWSEADVVSAMYPTYLNSTYGLLDASGAGIVEWLASIGVSALNNPDATFQELLDAAGHQPMVIGGRTWCHWVAVRMGGPAAGYPQVRWLALMNPSPGYMGVAQWLNEDNFDDLGPFSAVWFTSW